MKSPRLLVSAVLGAILVAGGAAVPAVAADAPSIPVYALGDGAVTGLAVQITVAGAADPVLVHLDTGSSGLIIEQTAVDAAAMTDLDAGFEQNYVDHSVLGEMYSAPVALGGVTSLAVPIGVESSIECSTGTTCWPFGGTVGTLGIGQGSSTVGDSTVQLASPLGSVTGADGEGISLTVDAAPGAIDATTGLAQIGTLTFGRPYSAAGDMTDLKVDAASGAYPNGNPVFSRRITLGWTVAGATATNITTFDTGAPKGFLFGTQFAASAGSDGELGVGTPITLTAPAGEVAGSAPAPSPSPSPSGAPEPFAAWTVTADSELTWTEAGNDGFTDFNTGLAFFLGRTVAFDAVDGHMKIGALDQLPDTAPAQPQVSETTATTATVLWARPESTVGLPHGGYTVTAVPVTAPVASVAGMLRAAAPATVTVSAAASARSAQLTGLTPGTVYDVSVVVFNARGSSPAASVRVQTLAVSSASPTLAESGGDPGVALGAGVGMLLLGALAVVLVRRRRVF